MKINATVIDVVLLFLTIYAGLESKVEFAVMMFISLVWFSVHLSFSRKTFKVLREKIEHFMFG